MSSSAASSRSALERLIFRIGLACAGGLLLHLSLKIVFSAPIANFRGYIPLLILTGLAGLLSLASAGMQRPPDWLRWLALLASIADVLIGAALWLNTRQLPAGAHTDQSLHMDLAAELARRGQNPYTWDYSGIFDVYRTEQIAGTPLLDGSLVRTFSYPALAFLLAVPFQSLGLPGGFALPIAAQIGVLVLLFLRAPRPLQPLVLFPTLVGMSFSGLSALGANDIVWAGLLAAAVLAQRKMALSAFFLGLGASYKQTVWFVIPFWLVHLWQSHPSEKWADKAGYIARFTLIAVATFLLINLPYTITAPADWLAGVLTPLGSPMIYLSQGSPSGLTLFGYILLPKAFYLVALATVFGLLLYVYWRHYHSFPGLHIVLPAIVLWFSYRTLISYWTYWVFPALAVLITALPGTKTPRSRASWRPTLRVSAIALIVFTVLGVVLSGKSPAISVKLIPPILTSQGMASQIAVKITNNSRYLLTPRFSAHIPASVTNALPWRIERGPERLRPGESGVYEISSSGQVSFPGHVPAQLVVTDASGNYDLIGHLTFEAESSFLWPDAIANPDYLYWDIARTGPLFWGPEIVPPEAGRVDMTTQAGRDALHLMLRQPGKIAVTNVVNLPTQPFGLWVYVDPTTSGRMGLEVYDGERHLYIVFGSRDRSERRANDEFVIERAVPLGMWTYQTIDLMKAYAQAGWTFPPLQGAVYREIEADFRLAYLSLYLTSSQPVPLDGYFGPIQQDDYRVQPTTLMAETLQDPAAYYTRLARFYARTRNYGRAIAAGQRALAFAPGNADVLAILKELELYVTR